MKTLTALVLGLIAGTMVACLSNLLLAPGLEALLQSPVMGILWGGRDPLGAQGAATYAFVAARILEIVFLAKISSWHERSDMAVPVHGLVLGCALVLMINAASQAHSALSWEGSCNCLSGTPETIEQARPTSTDQPRLPSRQVPVVPTPAPAPSQWSPPASPSVYICKGPSSRRYHLSRSCQGLTRCSTYVDRVSLNGARSIGRTLCGFED